MPKFTNESRVSLFIILISHPIKRLIELYDQIAILGDQNAHGYQAEALRQKTELISKLDLLTDGLSSGVYLKSSDNFRDLLAFSYDPCIPFVLHSHAFVLDVVAKPIREIWNALSFASRAFDELMASVTEGSSDLSTDYIEGSKSESHDGWISEAFGLNNIVPLSKTPARQYSELVSLGASDEAAAQERNAARELQAKERVRDEADRILRSIDEYENERPQLGHNHPPEPINEFQELKKAVSELKAEAEKKQSDPAKSNRAMDTINVIFLGLLSGGAKYIGGLVAQEVWPFMYNVLLPQLSELISSAAHWLSFFS